MSDYGQHFERPPIHKSLIPGGWTHLWSDSPFIISAVEHTLQYISHELHYHLSPTVNVTLFKTGAQIVAGINIYLEFRLSLGQLSYDVQAELNEPAVGNDKSRFVEMNVQRIFVTSKKIFDDEADE